MEQTSGTPGLRESMQEQSKLSGHNPAELKAYDLIYGALADVIEPGERVLAYADRDLNGNQSDALAYDTAAPAEQPDVMGGYRSGDPAAQTDAFAYDQEAGRAEPDVMGGYRPGGPGGETDAFAYERTPRTPQTDAFMSPGEARAADVDFLVLTDTRLIRGFLERDEVMITEALYEEPQVRVLAENYVAVRLPPAVCGLAEGDWWCWRVPEGLEPRTAAQRWLRGS
jgi:hypothetical protein